MKKTFTYAAIAIVVIALFFACKKQGESNQVFNESGKKSSRINALLACTYETLTGDINANRTLSSSIIYKLDGCVTVKSGVTLTIGMFGL